VCAMKTIFRMLLIVCLIWILGGCIVDGQSSDDDDDTFVSDDGWEWDLRADGSLAISYDDRPMFTVTGVQIETFTPDVSMMFGFFDHEKVDTATTEVSFSLAEGGLVLMVGDTPIGTLKLSLSENRNLRLAVRVDHWVAADAIRLLFALGERDRFWGFGEQYNYIDFRGRRVPIWVQEQGVGRSGHPWFPFIGELTDSYFPMPYFIDPEAGRGFLVENSEYSLFDLGDIEPGQWSVETWNGHETSYLIFPGDAPADLVQQLLSEVGRQEQAPPDWAFTGVWMAAQGGTAAVRARAEKVLDAGIPMTAVWVQDWLGQRDFGLSNFGVKYHWTHDEEFYPGLSNLIADLRAEGVRFLGYFNPFVAPAYDQYADGAENGYLIRRPDGDPYLFLISTFVGTVVDVSNPSAGLWFQEFARDAVALGMSGWMADFGEWLPFDAEIAGAEAPSYHNLYPTEWHRLNREILEQAYPDGDWVMLTRSGFTGEQDVAQIVWAGDQEATWSVLDGLPTVVKAGLTLSLAGISVFSHDIAGFSGGPSTKELFMRWTELGAFTPVMRTHDGLQKQSNHRFDSDAETLKHFTLFAKIHELLSPYFIELAAAAADGGLPLVRHTVLVDPDWCSSYEAHDQWMIGEDLLVAPVVEQGVSSIQVALPAGTWRHLLTGKAYKGRNLYIVEAPIGLPAVFVREGKLMNAAREIKNLHQEMWPQT